MSSTSTVKLRQRRQITLPKEATDAMQLHEGSELEVTVVDDGIFMRPRIVIDPVELDDDFVREMIEATRRGFEALADDEAASSGYRAETKLFDGAAGDALDGD